MESAEMAVGAVVAAAPNKATTMKVTTAMLVEAIPPWLVLGGVARVVGRDRPHMRGLPGLPERRSLIPTILIEGRGTF